MKKIIRVATHSGSLGNLLQGQLRFMSDHYEVVGVGSAGESENGKTTIQELAATERIRVVPVEMTRSITPIRDMIALYQLYRLFKSEQPQIVHSHTPKAGMLSMVAARIAGVPLRLHTVAGLPLVEAKGIKRKIFNSIEKLTYACATKVYPNSYGLKDIILSNKFVHEGKLKIIGAGSSNGIDTSHFDPENITSDQKDQLREETGLSSADFTFIFLGRIVRDKGINELIKAFKNVAQNDKNAKLLLVGYYDTSTSELLPETEKEIMNNKNIVLIGWQKDVRPYLAISDVLVFPSYREGFPNTVLQASAMKVPSIVTDINGCNEIIKDGYNGLIIPLKNVSALQNEMNNLLTNKKLYQRLAANSRTSISENYERKNLWKSLLEEYRHLDKNTF